MKKVLKKVIFLVLAVAMVLSFNTVAMKNTVKAANVVPFQVTSPTANKLVPAGHVTITWSNGNSYGTVKNYTVYVDGKKETTTTSTSYDFYTTKVNIHSVWVTAQMTNGKYMDTATVKFKVLQPARQWQLSWSRMMSRHHGIITGKLVNLNSYLNVQHGRIRMKLV